MNYKKYALSFIFIFSLLLLSFSSSLDEINIEDRSNYGQSETSQSITASEKNPALTLESSEELVDWTGNSYLEDEFSENFEALNSSGTCVIAGCSNELCVESDRAAEIATSCIYSKKAQCINQTNLSCSRQTNGECGWNFTSEYYTCTGESPPTTSTSVTIGIHNSNYWNDPTQIQNSGIDYRYQYLTGGANTGSGWKTWQDPALPEGQFVIDYIQGRQAAGLRPAFTYYQIYNSSPGGGSETDAILNNFTNASTMKAYLEDFQLAMEKIESTGNTNVIMHIEPDMWGFTQKESISNDPATIPVSINNSGYTGINTSGLNNDLTGLAQAYIQIRDQYAPTTSPELGFHVSNWATGTDFIIQDSSDAEITGFATEVSNFYNALNANFEYIFGEFRDRDAGLCENPSLIVSGDSNCNTGPDSRYTTQDFQRHILYFDVINANATNSPPVILWQIPFGDSTRGDTGPNDFSDNIIETLLDSSNNYEILRQYETEAGLEGLFFGDGCTDCSNPINYTYNLIDNYTTYRDN